MWLKSPPTKELATLVKTVEPIELLIPIKEGIYTYHI